MEGDANAILKAILTNDVSHSEYGHVPNDVLVLANEFRFCYFFHVKRVGNSIAYFLAKNSKSSNELQVWMESILEDIALLVIMDYV